MAKKKALLVIGIIIGASLLVGVGIVGGKMMSSNNTQDTNENATTSLETANNGTVEPAKPTEKLVGKTGVCSTGEIKYLSEGTYVVGKDIASGEYTAQHNPKNGDNGNSLIFSFFVYPTKVDFDEDNYGTTTRIMLSDVDQTESVKIDEGNYLAVKIGGKLVCQ